MPSIQNQVSRRPSTQDVSWFLDLASTGQLDLNPSYQRRSVWNSKDRKYFLDTIFRGFPCPPIYLHKTIRDGRSVYAVVDGKQRLETVLMFRDNRIALPNAFGDARLDGKKWKQIKDENEAVATFLNYVFPVEFVELPFNDTAYVNDVFDRLNRNSKILNPQELRHAKYSGWFINLVEDEVYDKFWQNTKVRTKARSRRMLDVQFVSELLLIIVTKSICGFSQEILDGLYATYDDVDDFDADNEWRYIPLVEEDFRSEIDVVKNKISEILNTNSMVEKFLTDTKHLYSLWAYLVLGANTSNIAPFNSEKYISFIEKYREVEASPNPLERDSWDPIVYGYYDASRGATTEEPQRKKRQEMLEQIMGQA
ncbi:DUF262 domain-containing protein [Fibrobacter sp.]|uniref:DUF262 domain-containing protein n=1 Tax=Fibrobacter sp. TaxID=35828 RepID=UPI00388F1FFF